MKIEFFLFLRKALLYEGMWLYPLGLFIRYNNSLYVLNIEL